MDGDAGPGVHAVWLGWPEEAPTLALDHRRFSYAGKFRMSNTGKAIAVTGENGRDETAGVLAAVSFNADRTEPTRAWVRYVTVRADRHGEGIGPRLIAAVRDRLAESRFDRLRIAVNNPFAYLALSRAGFADVDRETGLAERVLEWPADRSPERFHAGLEAFLEAAAVDRRALTEGERACCRRWMDRSPPEVVEPLSWDPGGSVPEERRPDGEG